MMEIVCFCFYTFLWTVPVFIFLLHRKLRENGLYTYAGWYPLLKSLCIKASIKKYQQKCKQAFESTDETEYEKPRDLLSNQKSDSHLIYGLDFKGNVILIKIILKQSLHAELFIEFRLNNGKIYRLPDEDGVVICSITSRQWKAQGLFIQVLEPFRRLRITYNGFMKNISSKATDDSNIEHVQFNFIWNAASKPMHYPQDTDSNLLIRVIAEESWLSDEYTKLLTSEHSYEQFGALYGFLKGSSYSEEWTFRLPSWRRRRWGISESISMKRDCFMFGACKDGTLFSIGTKVWSKAMVPFKYGIVSFSNGECLSISGSSISLEPGETDDEPKSISINFTADKRSMKCAGKFKVENKSFCSNHEEYGWQSTFVTTKCNLDGFQATAVATYWKNKSGTITVLPKPLLKETPSQNIENVLICRLTDPVCMDLSVTGGKGNSLGLLSHIDSDEFMIPEGFVVTVLAFRKQLIEKPHLVKAIKKLENVCYGKIPGKIEDVSKETSDLFSKESVCEDISKLIVLEIQKINETKTNVDMKSWRWAVRSSGVGEDSDQLSAAGQNSTYLGCKDEDVLQAISACWGSLFTFQSVQYRRQHGIAVNCEMGVVVQKMVPADCAGVLFTCHPVTADPSKMIITSNYGLGESVVAASADVDTVILSRSWDGKISIFESKIGNKKTHIILDTSRNDIEGTTEKEIDPELTKKLSITEDQALRLGRLAVALEKEFGSPRDIEWAFSNNKLYLLQSRPVTTLTTWTDYELLHEFDTPVLNDDNLYTRVNIGEVMKGATTVLTRSTMLNQMNIRMQKEDYPLNRFNPYVFSLCPTVLHYSFLDVLNVVYQKIPAKITVNIRVVELALIGYPLLDEKLHKEAIKRHGVQGIIGKCKHLFHMFKKLWYSNKNMGKVFDISRNWNIALGKDDNVLNMYTKINDSLYMIGELIAAYGNVMFASIFYQMMPLNMLMKGQTDFSENHFHDISLILCTGTGVETVEMPIMLEKIASIVRNSEKAKEFMEIDSKEGVKWLKQNCTEAAAVFAKFLDDHGHRLFKEYELNADTWKENPAALIKMIQSNCKTETTTKKSEGLTVDDTIAKLITPQSNLSKKILKFLINKLRYSLIAREKTKSQVIKSLGKFRNAYKQLAAKMVQEGYLPQADLIYHLTQTELEEVIRNRDPILVTKAIRRKRLYPQWDSLQFSDICKGYPVPDRDGKEEFVIVRSNDDTVTISGTPVYPGTVVARASVIVDLKECIQIQPGDILITYSTDVGWTPYFPMLSGVVTEIGGLISHGAIVAREYGLPCIVGAKAATKAFKTGDKVLLNGKNGTLELISEK